MTDADTSAAIEWLTRSLRDRDTALHDGEDYADAEVFAAEVVTAMRGHGWRPTAAVPYAAPKAAPAELSARLKPETADLLRDLHADMDARAARDRATREGAA